LFRLSLWLLLRQADQIFSLIVNSVTHLHRLIVSLWLSETTDVQCRRLSH